jgi:pyruvate formate lyase activating enzyme
MQGMIFDIRSFSIHDGPGIRQTVFLKGCPMRCSWCHNPESQETTAEPIGFSKKIGNIDFSVTETVGKIMSVSEVMESIVKDVLFFEESGGGVTLSGGEPLLQPEFCLALLKACSENGIHTALDTCGYAGAVVVDKILPFTELLLYDLKLANDAEHKQHTGVSNRLVLQNLEKISRAGKSIIIRIPLIPDITDRHENLMALRQIAESTPGICRIDLLPFHSAAGNKYKGLRKNNLMGGNSSYDIESAEKIKEFFSESAPIVSIGG